MTWLPGEVVRTDLAELPAGASDSRRRPGPEIALMKPWFRPQGLNSDGTTARGPWHSPAWSDERWRTLTGCAASQPRSMQTSV